MYKSLLFLCVANSARSQMAEGFARTLFGGLLRVQSAGRAPVALDALTIASMRELGVDVAEPRSKSVRDIDPASVDAIITLCAESVCPAWSETVPRMHWPLPEPAGAGASVEAVRARLREIRDGLQFRLWAFASANLPDGITLGPPTGGELAAIEALIRGSELPVEVVRDRFPDAYVVARREGRVVGVAALETYEQVGLLRSVAVAPSERGRGTGIALVADRLATGWANALTSVYLLTTTAAPLFRRFGFVDADRASVPDVLAGSPEFAALCPASSACLKVDFLRPSAREPVSPAGGYDG